MSITYYKSSNDDGEVIIAYIPGAEAQIANSDHPNYARIVEALAQDSDPDEVLKLFSPEATIREYFQQLTDRVAVRNGRIYYDDVEVHNLVADTIIRFMQEGQDFMPVVRFMQKLFENPTPHSIEQAWRWLAASDLTIHPDGDVVGYKGCRRNDEGILESTTQAGSDKVYVDGIEHTGGYIPYPLGSTVVMPRDSVVHDPGASCSHGLHVGTFTYAQGYASNGAVLEVKVNPADIVSVPNRENEKMRVCKLVVIREIDAKIGSVLRPAAIGVTTGIKAVVAEPVTPGLIVEPEPYPAEVDERAANVLPVEVKHPSRAAFKKMQARAKSRRQNFTKYATKMGPWTLVGEDPSKRESWAVEA